MDEREEPQHEDLKIVESSIAKLNANLEAVDRRKAEILSKMQSMRERVDKNGASANVQRLLSLLQSLKGLEKQVADVDLHCNATYTKLQVEVGDLDEMILNDPDGESFFKHTNDSLSNAVEKLNSAKRALASKLQEVVMLRRRLDDVPTQAELIQYERCFSELNAHIQGKLRQTRKHYATYNTLLEIKEMMLKETSLLNSISSQFQDAISSPSGRMTLISSMEGILMSIEQKLQNVQLALHVEQRACESLKEKHSAATSEQRRCYTLLKSFQEECAKNEQLRGQTSEILT